MQNDQFQPDSTFKFPVTVKNGKARRANSKWFEDRDWLHYDVKENLIFCYVCQKELKKKTILKSKRIEPAFVSTGFKDWQNALDSFKKHEKSDVHRQATENQFENRPNIGDILTHGNLKPKEKQQNWQCLLKIFSVIKKLARQSLALR